MRHATLALAGLLTLAALVAARPRVTFDELVGRVEALEERVKAMEANRPPQADPNAAMPARGEIRVGMTAQQAKSAMANLGLRLRENVSGETAAGTNETWWITPSAQSDVNFLRLRNGVVTEVGRRRTP